MTELSSIIYLILLLVLVGGVVIAPGMMKKNLQAAALWGVVFVLVLLGYRAYENLRATPYISGGGAIYEAPYSRFYGGYSGEVLINNQSIRAIFDTGATQSIIPYEEAEKLGVNMNDLRFNHQFSTANGIVDNARAPFDTICIHEYCYEDLAIFIAPKDALQQSLIGTNFLRALRGFSANGETLFLEL